MKKTILIILLLVSPLCLMANVPLAVSIGGPKKISTGSSKVPYTCDVQGNLNGTILSYCWTCMGENGEDYSDLFDGGTTNTYRIYINDAPTNFWLDVYMYYRSNTDSNIYVLATEDQVRVMEPVFNIERQAGLNGGTPNSSTLIHMYFNTDDDDKSGIENTDIIDYGEDFLQDIYDNSTNDDEMLYLRFSTTEPGLEIRYGQLEVSVGEGLRVWKNNSKNNNALLFEKDCTTIANGSTASGQEIINEFISDRIYVEGVDRNQSSISVKFNNKNICLLRYQAHAPTVSRLPKPSERDYFEIKIPNLPDCDWRVVLEKDKKYNCIAYAVQPSVATSGNKFFVIKNFDANDPLQVVAHNYLIGKPVGTYYTFGNVRYTSMDVHGNADMVFQTGDITSFFTKYGYTTDTTNPQVFYYNNYHAARQASTAQRAGFYNNYDIVVSKCGEYIGIVHRATDVISRYGQITYQFVPVPQPEPDME